MAEEFPGREWQDRSAGCLHTLFSLIYQEGESERWGRRSSLGWDEELAALQQKDDTTLKVAAPIACVVPGLPVPAGCREDLARYLRALARDVRKQADVRDMRVTALSDASAGEKLDIANHPTCGVVQFSLSLTFLSGTCKDWFKEATPLPLTQALTGILQALGVSSNGVSITSRLEKDRSRWSMGPKMTWLVTVRTESGMQAHQLKQHIEPLGFCDNLQAKVPLSEILRNEEDSISYHPKLAGGDSFPGGATFKLTLGGVRVLGGRIVDIIDPSRTSTEPPLMPCTEVNPPMWVPALVLKQERDLSPLRANGEIDELRFASEISGIPWMGSQTLSNPLYQRLAQVLSGMQALFANIGYPLSVNSPCGVKVLVKAQVYVLQTGDEIIGQLHQEGIQSDRIESVGLYYPVVDEALTGGDLEITVVMRGGCGSKFPVSKSIPVAPGTAIVFDNANAYHCMTSLTCKSRDAVGERLVLGFFVMRTEDGFQTPPGNDSVTVNYSDKARLLVLLLEKSLPHQLPKNVHAAVAEYLAGGPEYLRQQFEASRSARSKPVTNEGLTVCACD